jgi:hypothetical protein
VQGLCRSRGAEKREELPGERMSFLFGKLVLTGRSACLHRNGKLILCEINYCNLTLMENLQEML